jgi:lysophospholipid acyltransferase (LPLAT)-like uncharacterized protein
VSETSVATRTQIVFGKLNALVLPRLLDLMDLRICYYDRSVDPARPEYNEHAIFSFWHEYISVVLPRWGQTPLTVLCSQHRDGEWVNQTALSLGVNVVRGSTTRGGSAAIRQLKKNGKMSSIALTPDGPRGPRREMALGPIFLASLLGLPVVPVGVSISNAYRLNTWDHFAIPRPTSRVRYIFGPKIYIPRKSSRDQLEASRLGVQQLMNDLCDTADQWADSGEKMIGEQAFQRARRTNRIFFEQEQAALKVVGADEDAA